MLLSLGSDKDRRRKADRPEDAENGPRPAKKSRKRAASGDVGTALRSIYDTTVGEPVPPEMLDLLGKLG